jgi:tellurite resistance protein
MAPQTESIIGKVALELSRAPAHSQRGVKESILVAAATSYGAKSEDDLTQPTGFDPEAARLFEAIVESAYLVANADGSSMRRSATRSSTSSVAACEGKVAEGQIAALLSDLAEQLAEDGSDKRVQMVTGGITKTDHAREVLRVAALLAHVSGGVSPAERALVEKLAQAHRPRYRRHRHGAHGSLHGTFEVTARARVVSSRPDERGSQETHRNARRSGRRRERPRRGRLASIRSMIRTYRTTKSCASTGHLVETRMLDERFVALQRQGRVGFHVGSLGEEAAILGSAWAMREQDFPVSPATASSAPL